MMARLTPRRVAGMDAAASAASPAVTPEITRNGTPAAARANISSPPRPNTKGAPPLSPTLAPGGAGMLVQPFTNAALRGRRFAAALAGKFQPRLRSRQRQDAPVDECVVHDDICLGKTGECIERQQARVARPRAGEPHVSGGKNRNWGAQRRE